MVIASPSAPVASTRTLKPSAFIPLARAAAMAFAEQPGGLGQREELRECRARAAAAIAALPPAQRDGVEVEATRELLKIFIECGASNLSAAPEDIAQADRNLAQGWPGLLAAMLLVPAWQWRAAPALDAVPSWLWADYTRYLFYPPQGFSGVGDENRYAAHILVRLEQLARLAGANRGSSAVRAATNAFLETANFRPLQLANDSLRKHLELRGRILAAAAGTTRPEFVEPRPRDGRRLRIGFVSPSIASQTETSTTLPLFAQLDPERFEVLLFVSCLSGTAVEDYAKSCVAEFHVLPATVSERADAIRAADLDTLVFATDLATSCSDLTLLALHRLAPLQVATGGAHTTTGLAEIDLYVSGADLQKAESASEFTERLGLVPGPGQAFNFEADNATATTTWSREALSIASGEIVFVSAADHRHIAPETQQTWARLLAAVPNSRLLLHPFHAEKPSESLVLRFSAALESTLVTHGVDPTRLMLSAERQTRANLKELLALGDVYLDAPPLGDSHALVLGLERGLPAVVAEGGCARFRTTAALLRSLGLGELVAADADAYFSCAVRVATEETFRTQARERIADAMGREPVFRDSLAASDALGELLLRAFDELYSVGAKAFRQDRTPLLATASAEIDAFLETARSLLEVGLLDDAQEQAWLALAAQPAHVGARQAMARVLEKRGRLPRATDYLLGAVQRGDASAAVWRDLARLLDRGGRGNDAVVALETALRVDPTDSETWFMLGDLAARCGHAEILREVAEVLGAHCPTDPRTASLQAQAREKTG